MFFSYPFAQNINSLNNVSASFVVLILSLYLLVMEVNVLISSSFTKP